MNDIKRGYIVEFKLRGFAFRVLASLLKFFERDWDKWGWHLAIAYEKSGDGWYILEARAGGTEINYYPNFYLKEHTRSYQWLDKEPRKKRMAEFLALYQGKKYDVAIYFWTTLQYLIRHYFNHRIPRLLDDRFTCWELVSEFCEHFGKPIESKYDCPMITDILGKLRNQDE